MLTNDQIKTFYVLLLDILYVKISIFYIKNIKQKSYHKGPQKYFS